MEPGTLLQWHYIIFLLPFCLAVLLLLLSSVRTGHHRGAGHARHGHGGLRSHSHAAPHGHASGGHSHAQGGHGAKAHSPGHKTQHGSGKSQVANRHAVTPGDVVLGLLGVGRAPTSIVLQTFCMAWGFCGFWANQLLLKTPAPTLIQMLPSLAIALFGGIAGARISAEIFARIMPQEETFVVSRDELFGLTGNVAFPVTETSGRIRIYDDNGTLHDEMCRVAPGHVPIEKGCKALVIDMDPQGNLIVEPVTTRDRV